MKGSQLRTYSTYSKYFLIKIKQKQEPDWPDVFLTVFSVWFHLAQVWTIIPRFRFSCLIGCHGWSPAWLTKQMKRKKSTQYLQKCFDLFIKSGKLVPIANKVVFLFTNVYTFTSSNCYLGTSRLIFKSHSGKCSTLLSFHVKTRCPRKVVEANN